MEQETRAGAALLLRSTGEKQSRLERRANSTYRAGRGISAHVWPDLGTETPDGLRRNIAGLPPTFISIFRSFYISFFGEKSRKKGMPQVSKQVKIPAEWFFHTLSPTQLLPLL